MSNNDNLIQNDRPVLTMKGSLAAAVVNGDTVELWFQSPTGDSSDSQIFELRCRTPQQAEAVAALHRSKWGIPDYSKSGADA